MFITPQPFSEAIGKLGSRSPLAANLNTAEWHRIPVALREAAFLSANVQEVRFLQLARDLINAHLKGEREQVIGHDGVVRTALRVGGKARFIELMQEAAVRFGMGPLRPQDAGTLKDITSERRLALIFDVQTEAARSYGQWLQGMDPVILHLWPAYRFVREVEVKKPRRRHVDNEGVVRLKTDLKFWLYMNASDIGGFGVPWGPWGFNSGMGVQDVDRTEAERLGLIKPGEAIKPVVIDFNANLQAGTANLDPDLIAWLKSVLGPRAVVEDRTIRWSGIDLAPEPKPKRVPRPVSESITHPSGPLREDTREALRLIDSIHGDGDLPNLTMIEDSVTSSNGYFRPSQLTIGLQPSGPHPTFTAIHEVGHFLDFTVLRPEGAPRLAMGSNVAGSEISPIVDALEKTPEVRKLLAAAKHDFYTGLRAEYLTQRVELWARAYQQYIAVKSGDETLLRQLMAGRSVEPGRFWPDDEFAPIVQMIDTLFHSKGWM